MVVARISLKLIYLLMREEQQITLSLPFSLNEGIEVQNIHIACGIVQTSKDFQMYIMM